MHSFIEAARELAQIPGVQETIIDHDGHQHVYRLSVRYRRYPQGPIPRSFVGIERFAQPPVEVPRPPVIEGFKLYVKPCSSQELADNTVDAVLQVHA